MKVSLKIALLVLGFWALSCSSGADKDILSKEKLAFVLTDIHMAEARINEKHIGSSDSALVLFQEYQRQIFKKHGVDSVQVNKSFEAYVKEPDEFLEMYEMVSEELTKQVKPH